jgi:hypothetical protein
VTAYILFSSCSLYWFVGFAVVVGGFVLNEPVVFVAVIGQVLGQNISIRNFNTQNQNFIREM